MEPGASEYGSLEDSGPGAWSMVATEASSEEPGNLGAWSLEDRSLAAWKLVSQEPGATSMGALELFDHFGAGF